VKWDFVLITDSTMLRRILGPKREDVDRNGENFVMRRFVISTLL
jgi:hypothetical protein